MFAGSYYYLSYYCIIIIIHIILFSVRYPLFEIRIVVEFIFDLWIKIIIPQKTALGICFKNIYSVWFMVVYI